MSLIRIDLFQGDQETEELEQGVVTMLKNKTNCRLMETIPSYYSYNGNYYSLSNLKILPIFVIMKENKPSNVSNYSRLKFLIFHVFPVMFDFEMISGK